MNRTNLTLSVQPGEKAVLIDVSSDILIYKGYPIGGADEGVSQWAIEKVFFDDPVWKHHWAQNADGIATKQKIHEWDERATYTYTQEGL